MSCEIYFMFEDYHGWVNLSLGDTQFLRECSYIRDTPLELADILVKLKRGSYREYLMTINEPTSDFIEFIMQGDNLQVRTYQFNSPEEIPWTTKSLSKYAYIIAEKVPEKEFSINLVATIEGFLESFEKLDSSKYYEQWGHAWPSSLLMELNA